MSHQHNSTQPTQLDAEHRTAASFAHEMSNLLDGGMRNVNLVLRAMRELECVDAATVSPPQPLETHDPDHDLLYRLESVNHAMGQMATLIHRWMQHQTQPRQLHDDGRSLKQMLGHAVRLLEPAAKFRGVRIETRMAPEVADLPAGPTYPVVANAIRNSLEAFDRTAEQGGRKMAASPRVCIDLKAVDNDIELSVTDNGPGLDDTLLNDGCALQFGTTTKPGGHGLGLALCNDIARSLGGTLTLCNVKPHGAKLTLRYPRPRPGDDASH